MFSLSHMLSFGNTGRWRCAAALPLALAGMMMCGASITLSAAGSQPLPAATGSPRTARVIAEPRPGAPDPTRLPDPEAALRVYRLVREAIARMEAPASPAADLPAVAGCSIQLRYGGMPLARGSAYHVQFAAPATGAPILEALVEAITEAELRLPPIPNDLLREQAMAERAANILVSIELAGGPTPITPETYAEAERTLAPGLSGITVVIGGRSAAIFPGTMLTSDMMPHKAISAAASAAAPSAQMGLDEPATLVKQHGAQLYKFRVVHLAQTGAGMEPIFLHRGGRVAPLGEMTAAGLRGLAQRLAGHLERRYASDIEYERPVQVTDPYDPLRNRSDPDRSGSGSEALAGYALARYAASGIDAEPAGLRAAAAKMRAAAHLRFDAKADDAFARCALVLADVALTGALKDGQRSVDELEAALLDEGKLKETLPVTSRGIAAYALTLAKSRHAAGVVRQVFRETPDADLVAQMPWLGWAELELAKVEATPDLAAALALRRMRALLWEFQIAREGLSTDDADLAGGVVFTTSLPPRPNSQIVRPLAFVASMLADSRLTEAGERAPELARLLSALRFVRQLTAGEATMWMYARPEIARGGVRSSLWDQSMPVDATSLALLSVCEAVESLERMARPAPERE
ncbi:MAG: hypothetical protein H7Y88_05980 [Phycisphaerales bacterium]|nr:hypothetical protein [Phycisphaerales bacterium]